MKKRIVQSLIIGAFLLGTFSVAKSENRVYEGENSKIITTGPRAGVCDICPIFLDLPNTSYNEVMMVSEEVEEIVEEPNVRDTITYLTYERMGFTDEEFCKDLDLLALIVEAEAGNQSSYGKRLVIDTVLNRMDSPYWRDDDTIYEVITHPGQYDTWSNGAYKKVAIDEDIKRLVEEEILSRTNSQVIYFKTNGYFSGAPKILKEGDHWFSGEERQW